MTDIVPDYFVHETDQWLVFPHELSGLTDEEIAIAKPEIWKTISAMKTESEGS